MLEVTEHAAVRDMAQFRQELDRHRAVGFHVAMDDVGSGYAGLQTIAEIAPDYLKIDMTLVRDLHRDPMKRELIATIRRFTDATGSTLVAEGVECADRTGRLADRGRRALRPGVSVRAARAPAEDPRLGHLQRRVPQARR